VFESAKVDFIFAFFIVLLVEKFASKKRFDQDTLSNMTLTLELSSIAMV
jgi:hypothetical protein